MTAAATGAGSPLSGVRVLDCTRLLPFSYGTQMLADLGASVTKVEPPGGEYGRAMHGEFAMTNRNKHSVEIDLATAEGHSTFLALVAEADVVMESFRPGVMADLGLDYAALKEANLSIILCSATGYGQDGPSRHQPGHDLNYWSVAGGVQLTNDHEPLVFPVPVADMAAGIMCAFLVSSAVVEQRSTGRGCLIDLSMTDLCLSMNTLAASRSWNAGLGWDKAPADRRLSGLPWPALLYGECPCYGVYAAADGKHLTLGNVEPKFWRNFLAEIGREDLAADRLATGERALEVRAELQSVLSGQPRAAWLEQFAGKDICFSLVNTIAEARVDPLFDARSMIWTDETGVDQIAFPATFDGIRPGTTGHSPAVGERVERPE